MHYAICIIESSQALYHIQYIIFNNYLSYISDLKPQEKEETGCDRAEVSIDL